MVTMRCTLTLADGRELVGVVTADSPMRRVAISLSGAIESFDWPDHEARVSDLPSIFEELARQQGGEVTTDQQGEYDVLFDY